MTLLMKKRLKNAFPRDTRIHMAVNVIETEPTVV